MARLVKVAGHLRRYLLLYVFLAIAIAMPIGYYHAGFFKAHKGLVKDAILFLAIGTLLPSMIQLRAGKMGREARSKWKETVVALIVIFLVAPAMAMLFAGHIGNRLIGIGYVAANSVPASSASVAYVMLAEGNIELATVLVILSVLIALFAAPLYIGLFAQSVHVNLPLTQLAKSVTIALLVPLILGQLIRYFLVTRRARELARDPSAKLSCRSVVDGEKEIVECLENKISSRIKPILSTWTMVFMLILISLLIANKAGLLISKPGLAAYIITAQLGIYATVIACLLVASLILKIRYRDHMAMAFISLTKNESVAAAIAVLAIGSTAAVPAALIPAVQPIVAILYVSASPLIKRLLGDAGGTR